MRTAILFLLLSPSSGSFYSAIAARALQLIPSKSRDKLAYLVPDFDLIDAAERMVNDALMTQYSSQLQPKVFTCRALSDLCPTNGQCLHDALKAVYGSLVGIPVSPSVLLNSSVLTRLYRLTWLVMSSALPFNLGFEADSAGRKSFVQHGRNDLRTIRDFFDTFILTNAAVNAVDAATLAQDFARETQLLLQAGDGNAVGAVFGSGVQRWLDQTSAAVCEIYEFYRSPQNRGELKASLLVGDSETRKFEEVGNAAIKRGIVRLAVVMHILASSLASQTDGSKNVVVLSSVVVIGIVVFIAMSRKWKTPGNRYTL